MADGVHDDPLASAIELLRAPMRGTPDGRERVMAAIRALPPIASPPIAIVHARRGSRRLRASSAVGALATAAGACVLLMLGAAQRQLVRVTAVAPAHDGTGNVISTLRDTLRLVQFALVAPGAVRVALVGDFNDWDTRAMQLVRDPSGEVWRASVRLEPGDHMYAFVVNDTGWVRDPLAIAAPRHELAPPRSIIHVGER